MSKPKFTPGPWIVKNNYQVVRDAGHPLPRVIVETTISGECDLAADGEFDEVKK